MLVRSSYQVVSQITKMTAIIGQSLAGVPPARWSAEPLAPFSDWANILFNTAIATAIADRLVENSEIFLLGGDSLRKLKTPNPPAESP
jgi:hypothetical protein